ncbi:MAG: cysteine hydrolase family protein [Planctomycetota bacterium]|nr:cysteine hydrolase family protein [Planctomycetota bacterium]
MKLDRRDFATAAAAFGAAWCGGRALALADEPARGAGVLRVNLRSRTRLFKGVDEWDQITVAREFTPSECAIIICDMWDKHWCESASRRCGELAVAMNPVVAAARSRGVRIIHAPSETMAFYAETPQRLRMKQAPKVARPRAIEVEEGPLPIDDSDGGCDDEKAVRPYAAWTRQHPAIVIGPDDGISDNGDEVYSFLRGHNISTVFMMGVHTNMCVLGRTFAIRSLTRAGLRCVLVRDLTDAMYDPRDRPHVSHAAGTALVVEHIEKYWAPSTTKGELSAALRGV